jgi:RNA polymerase sigma-70 factor (ECF subfamily)
MEPASVSANGLARLCSESGDEGAWREFVRRFQRPIALAVLRTARSWDVHSSAIVDDLVQETFLRLCADDCRLLRNFVPREPDSIIAYLKVLAANVTHDRLRNEKALKRGGAFRQQFEQEHENGASTLDSLFANSAAADDLDSSLRRSEIDRLLQSLIPDRITARDRTIFWLYFEEGFSAREISEIAALELSIKGVESSIHRTTQHVREAFAQQPLGRPPARSPSMAQARHTRTRPRSSPPEGISPPLAIYKEER